MHSTALPSRPLAAAALAALAAAALGVSACGGGSDPQLAQKTLKLTDRDTDFFSYLDVAPKTTVTADGPDKVSNGDRLTFSSDLLDASKKDVGDRDLSCVFVRATGRMESSSAVCAGVMTVPGGSLIISVGGTPFADGNPAGAITGGTGAYAGASGVFTSKGDPSDTTVRVSVPEQ